MSIKSFQEIEAWKHGHKAVLEVYRLTNSFPPDERFCLVQQMRRAALSVPANIAEGFGRFRRRDKMRFYNYSQSSLEELKYYVIASKDLGYGKDWAVLESILTETGRTLQGLFQRTATLPGLSDA